MKKIIQALCVSLLILMGLSSCEQPLKEPASPPSVTSTPFSVIPGGNFLFVFLTDDDYTCLDGLCGCSVSEVPAMPFEFVDGKLVIMSSSFPSDEPPTNWDNFRKRALFIGLYGYYSQWGAELTVFSSVPYQTTKAGLTILEVDSKGNIQIDNNGERTTVLAGSTYQFEQPEQVDSECKVLHKYELTNYGLIKDEDVEMIPPTKR